MILFSFVLYEADRRGRRTREVSELTLGDGIKIGVAQALALVPGVSRSGATISAGLLLGLTREAATRYSFLLSVPAVVLSGLFELRKVVATGTSRSRPTIIATIFAFISGYLAIAWLLRYVRSHNFTVFVVFRDRDGHRRARARADEHDLLSARRGQPAGPSSAISR